MYEAFYGLTGKPFQLNPDPAFYYASKEHRRAMAYLEYGVHKSEGFIVITGEVGAGKTTVVRNLLNQLDREKVAAAHLVTTQLNADDTLRMVAGAFGLPVRNVSKSETLLAIEAFLVKLTLDGRRALLIIDEAQNLTMQAMEELRMLSNYQLETQALLQSFLIGQPEFRQILESPQMLQLRQRVVAGCHISSMDQDETRQYVEHRLTRVGWKDDPHFDADAYSALFTATSGIPRRINAVCDRLLLSGYLGEKHAFTSSDVDEAARELKEETRELQEVTPDDAQSPPVENPVSVRAHPGPNGSSALAMELAALDVNKLQLDVEVARHLTNTIDELRYGQIEERLMRLERSSAATLTVLRELLTAIRTTDVNRPQ